MKLSDVEAQSRTAPAFMSVRDFYQSVGISRSFFYKLVKEGRAPPICKLGTRSLISAEAAAEWRRDLQGEAA
jgi:predicted DNA-binding transcriptional regulator AlpA